MLTASELQQVNRIFNPRSVAIVGATDSPDRVGYNLVESVLWGGFTGAVYPIHPRLTAILGRPVYPSLASLPGPVDVVVIALNQFATVDLLADCARAGAAGVICVAGGFKEMGDEGQALEEQLVNRARELGLKLIGPNTLGLINTRAPFYSTFYPLRLKPGKVSFVSQSGGVGLTIMHRCTEEGLGIAKWVGVGNRGSLEFADYLQYLAGDPDTSVIGMFVEGTEDARRLVELAGEVSRAKPVVILKGGVTEAANYAALTHTGSMAGSPQLFRDACRQYGVLTASTVGQLVAMCKALSLAPLPAGNRVGVFTHTAGPSILALDELTRQGCVVPPLSTATLRRVEEIIGPNPPVVLKNPLDVAGLGFLASDYGRLAETVLADPAVDILLAIYCLHKNWRFPSPELVRAREDHGKPVVALYVSTHQGAAPEEETLQGAGIPLFTSAEEAAAGVAALTQLARYRERRRD